jgi:hypothetical protein
MKTGFTTGILAIAALSTLSSCFLLSNDGSSLLGPPPVGECGTNNNESEDGFNMDMTQKDLLLGVGQTQAIAVKFTYLDTDLKRVEVSCKPLWSFSKQGVVKVDADTKILTTIAPGMTQVFGKITGHRTVMDSFWIAVLPAPSGESEPNDAQGIANTVTASAPVLGTLSDNNDQDWYGVTIPAGKGYSIALKPSIDLAVTGSPFSASYNATYYDDAGNSVSSNETYAGRNTAATDLKIFVRVNGYKSDIPYSLSVTLVN